MLGGGNGWSTGASHASHLGDCCPSAYSSGVSYVKKRYSTTIGRWTAIVQVTSMRGTCGWREKLTVVRDLVTLYGMYVMYVIFFWYMQYAKSLLKMPNVTRCHNCIQKLANFSGGGPQTPPMRGGTSPSHTVPPHTFGALVGLWPTFSDFFNLFQSHAWACVHWSKCLQDLQK